MCQTHERCGGVVPRTAALEMPNIADLWHVADHIVLDDPRLAVVREWLEGR